MKKIILAIFGIFLLMSMCACGDKTKLKLSSEMEQKIISAHSENISKKELVSINNYYGEYEEAYVISIKDSDISDLPILCKETIGNLVFMYETDTCARVFYNDEFYTFKEAYWKEILTLDALTKINSRFPKYSETYDCLELNGSPIIIIDDINLPKIETSIEQEIKQASSKLLFNNRNVNDITIKEYYGKYINSHVVRFEDSSTENAPIVEKIYNMSFRYLTNNPLKVYCDNKFYSLSEAVEKYLLTIKDLKSILALCPTYDESLTYKTINEDPIYKMIHRIYTTKLTDEEARKIKQTCLEERFFEYPEKTINDIMIYEYYGKFNDSYIVTVSPIGSFPSAFKQVIDGVVLKYRDSNAPVVYHEGKLYSLKDAFINKLITTSDLRELQAMTYMQEEPLTCGNLEEPYFVMDMHEHIVLEAVMKDVVIDAYISKCLIREKNVSKSDITITDYYGSFNGAIVARIDSPYTEKLAILAKETINNNVFVYEDTNSAKVYYEDNFYTLKEAYANRIITSDDLPKINKQFPIYNEYFMAVELNGIPT